MNFSAYERAFVKQFDELLSCGFTPKKMFFSKYTIKNTLIIKERYRTKEDRNA